jgi:hypothetical protein
MFADDGRDGIQVYDTTNPAAPTLISVAESDGPMWDLEAVGDYVYVANGSVLRIVDMSDPFDPIDLGSTGRAAVGICISETHAYLASFDAGLTVMDISNPRSPSFRGQVAMPDYARKVAVANGHAYVTVPNHGLQIVNVSDPTHPTLEGEFGSGEYFSDVAAEGNNVFVVGSGVLRILDVTNPVSPVQIGFYDPEGGPSAVDVAGNFAYVGVDPLHVLDISDPSHPALLGELDPMLAPGAPEQVKVVGDLVYLAHYIGGVSIVRGCHAIFVDGFETGDTSAWARVTAD